MEASTVGVDVVVEVDVVNVVVVVVVVVEVVKSHKPTWQTPLPDKHVLPLIGNPAMHDPFTHTPTE